MTLQSQQTGAYIKFILAIIAWAGVYQSASYLIKYIDPYSAAFFRYLIASIALVTILRIKTGKFVDLNQFKQNWRLLIGLGIVGIGLYNLAFFSAEKYLSANMVAIIISFSPCITALLAARYMRQRLNWMTYIAMLIALLGTVGVINYANPECGKFFCSDIFLHISKGEIYALAVCLFAAIYNIMNRMATQKQISSLAITSYAAVFGTVVLFFPMVILGKPSIIFNQNLEFDLVLLYTALIGPVLAYSWYSEAIKNLGVAKTVIFINAIPFVTILLGVILFREKVKIATILCGILIFTGVMLTNLMIQRNKKVS